MFSFIFVVCTLKQRRYRMKFNSHSVYDLECVLLCCFFLLLLVVRPLFFPEYFSSYFFYYIRLSFSFYMHPFHRVLMVMCIVPIVKTVIALPRRIAKINTNHILTKLTYIFHNNIFVWQCCESIYFDLIVINFRLETQRIFNAETNIQNVPFKYPWNANNSIRNEIHKKRRRLKLREKKKKKEKLIAISSSHQFHFWPHWQSNRKHTHIHKTVNALFFRFLLCDQCSFISNYLHDIICICLWVTIFLTISKTIAENNRQWGKMIAFRFFRPDTKSNPAMNVNVLGTQHCVLFCCSYELFFISFYFFFVYVRNFVRWI